MCRLPPTFLLPKLLHLVLTLSAWIFLIQAKLHKAQLGEGEIILQMIAKQTLATQTKGSSLPDLPLLSLCLSLSLSLSLALALTFALVLMLVFIWIGLGSSGQG